MIKLQTMGVCEQEIEKNSSIHQMIKMLTEETEHTNHAQKRLVNSHLDQAG